MWNEKESTISGRSLNPVNINKRISNLMIPTECRVLQTILTFSQDGLSSIAAADKNSYLIIRTGIGYQRYENGKLVVNCMDKSKSFSPYLLEKYTDVIYLKSQKAYFIHIDKEGIFKQERVSPGLKIWSKLSGSPLSTRSLSTTEQEHIIIFQAESNITVIPITSDGSPGTTSSWEWENEDMENITDHRVYGKRGDMIALTTYKSTELILLKINLGESTIKERKRYILPVFGDKKSIIPCCLAICPLKQILAVSLCGPHGLVLYKLQEDSAVILTILAVKNCPFYAMTMFGYRKDDLLISCISYSFNKSPTLVYTYRYSTVNKTLQEIKNLRKPAPVKTCVKMINVGVLC